MVGPSKHLRTATIPIALLCMALAWAAFFWWVL